MEDWERRLISGPQITVAGRNQHHPIDKLVYPSLLVFMLHQAKLKHKVCVQNILIRWRCPTIRHQRWKPTALFSPSPTETIPLAAASSPVHSVPIIKIWLKEDDKTKLAKVPLKGVQTSGSKVTGFFYSVVISSFGPYQNPFTIPIKEIAVIISAQPRSSLS